jgi:hypothetical protein
MIAHVHTWLAYHSQGRWRCACGVWGRRLGRRVIPVVCRKPIGESRRMCGAEAIVVDGNPQHSRCAEHAPTDERTSFPDQVQVAR